MDFDVRDAFDEKAFFFDCDFSILATKASTIP